MGSQKEMQDKLGLIFFIFMMVLCLVMVSANLFAAAGIGWFWVFAPLWCPFVLGVAMMALGIKPPQ